MVLETIPKREVPIRGPHGAYLGNLEYVAQSNESEHCVESDARYKFVDDLTALDTISLLLVGMTLHNLKASTSTSTQVMKLFRPKI